MDIPSYVKLEFIYNRMIILYLSQSKLLKNTSKITNTINNKGVMIKKVITLENAYFYS